MGDSSGDAASLRRHYAEERLLREEWKKVRGGKRDGLTDSEWQTAGLLVLSAIGILAVIVLASHAH